MVRPVANVANASGASVGALRGRILDDKMQLDDWSTCISAKTVKGQAEIQRLAGQVSADREQAARATALQAVAAAQSAAPNFVYGPTGHDSGPGTLKTGGLDVWA
jgi:hypothetical protein